MKVAQKSPKAPHLMFLFIVTAVAVFCVDEAPLCLSDFFFSPLNSVHIYTDVEGFQLNSLVSSFETLCNFLREYLLCNNLTSSNKIGPLLR